MQEFSVLNQTHRIPPVDHTCCQVGPVRIIISNTIQAIIIGCSVFMGVGLAVFFLADLNFVGLPECIYSQIWE